jgi:2-C-methyl-D-erythritol 4-phosphate cytidylyltransferase
MNNKTDNKRFWVIIPASGIGSRMHADRPKQYLTLLGKTILEHTLACFTQRDDVAGIVIGVSDKDPYWSTLSLSVSIVESAVPIYRSSGGKERCNTVLNALTALRENYHAADNDWVFVHDAARPCLLQDDFNALIASQQNNTVGSILAMPVRDTMKREASASGMISHTEDRTGMWHALTPQMFPLGLLYQALSQALAEGAEITDEASALEYRGEKPHLVEGAASNIKITRPADMALAEFFLTKQKRHSTSIQNSYLADLADDVL